jgi:hypothetical protein
LAGTRQRLSGFSQPRQYGDAALRMLVTGGPPNFGGGGISTSMRSPCHLGAAVRYFQQ